MSLYYFAFGSNMDIQQMEDRKKEFEEENKRIKVEFTDRQKGIIKDWKLIFNKISKKKEGSGYGNIEREIGSIVEGIIYKVNNDAIKMLDWYEGVRFDSYRQKEMSVENEKNESINCIVYIANPKKTDNSLKPTEEYLNHFLEGKEFLSENYYSELENTETLD